MSNNINSLCGKHDCYHKKPKDLSLVISHTRTIQDMLKIGYNPKLLNTEIDEANWL